MSENRHDNIPSNSIDDLFRSALEPMDDSPSAAVWKSVEKDLDKINIVSIKRKYDDLKKIAIALVLILSSTIFYELQTQHHMFWGKSNNNGIQNNNQPVTDVAHKEKAGENISKIATSPGTRQSGIEQSVPEQTSSNTARNEAAPVAPNNLLPFLQPDRADKSLSKNLQDVIVRQNVVTPDYTTSNIKGVDKAGTAVDRPGGFAPISFQQRAHLLASSFPSSIAFSQSQNIQTSSFGNYLIDYSNPDKLLPIKYSAPAGKGSDLAQQSVRLSEKRISPFSLSLIFSPDLTSRRVKEDWPVNREDNRDEIRKSERYGFSYSLGALVDYSLGKHWAIQSGFTLSRAVINFSPKFIFARPDDLGDVKYKFNSSSGYSYLSTHTMSRPVFGDSLHAFGSTSSLLYLSVPVSVKYKVALRKFELHASAGVAANILVKDRIQTYLFSGGSHEVAVNHDIRGLKPLYYSALLGAGVSYKISNRLAVNMTPTARVALTSINKDAPVKSYQQSLGMVAGMQLSF